MTLVDTNVLIDIASGGQWQSWSEDELGKLFEVGEAAVNTIIYAELASGFAEQSQLDELVVPELRRLDLPWDAAYLAGRRITEFLERGGSRSTPIGDFYIGAHAEVAGMQILTRDVRRFRTNFPSVRLICPPVS